MEAYCNPIVDYSTLSEVIKKQKEVRLIIDLFAYNTTDFFR